MAVAASGVLALYTTPSSVMPLVTCAAVGGVLPDVDEPQSLVSRRLPASAAIAGVAVCYPYEAFPRIIRSGLQQGDWMPLLLLALVALACASIGWLVPITIKRLVGHRGLIHHPLLGLALLLGALLMAWGMTTMLSVSFALGWMTHLIGDSLTYSGIPWRGRRRWWLVPAPLRFATGSVREPLAVAVWIAGCGLLAWPALQHSAWLP